MRFTDFSLRSTKIIKTQGETLKKKSLKYHGYSLNIQNVLDLQFFSKY